MATVSICLIALATLWYPSQTKSASFVAPQPQRAHRLPSYNLALVHKQPIFGKWQMNPVWIREDAIPIRQAIAETMHHFIRYDHQ